MFIYSADNKRIFENARFVLEDIAEMKAGDTVLVIADRECYTNARALCDTAKALGAKVMIIDIDMYGGEERYMKLPVMEPLRQAILHADIVFMATDQMRTDFGMFLGNSDECDSALLGHSRRFTFESGGMDRWELNKEEVLKNRSRTLKLYEWLKTAKQIRITSARGTDLTCDLAKSVDAMYPVMAIIPFYAEVAVIPSLETVNGVVVADGASEFAYGQRGFPIRPAFRGHQELWMEPMKLEFRDSYLVNYTGDPVQVARLKKLMEDVSPAPDLCDEIGLVTTTSIENDMYGWLVDGSHQTRCVHVAIGNNRRRGEIIHSEEHVDFDIHRPTVYVDGEMIFDGENFLDDVIDAHAAKA
ncbi:MAG: hypothetical protein IKM31_11060 [Oscillospiraceae bacterium]|nr:hypothetical protein [Oscillospiraceae bacterium]